MHSKHTRIVMLIAVLLGVAASLLVRSYGPITGVPFGGGGLVIALCALLTLRHRAAAPKA